MNPTLQGYAAAVLESVDTAQLPAVAAELEAIERLVRATPALEAALQDTAVSGAVRGAVMRDLLEGKVSGAARRAAAFATSVVSAPETVAALTWLALRAFARRRGRTRARATAQPPAGSQTSRRVRPGGV